ncbi:hypothetical protein [Staphylococcus sp. Marseille-Q6910]|uniref:hypothetical protein n=1 Tax=Staphylococcus sp. Marseille-Q6910 TaxID=2937990 RepID=UPI002040D154|nr:hypothetical protein [Staphylococcus sp. Marseille-Q6910]
MFSSLVTVGIFSSILTIYSAGNTLFFSVYNYILPKAVEHKNNAKFLTNLLFKFILSGFVFAILVVIVNYTILDKLIELVFNDHFYKYKYEIIIVIFSSILVYLSILFDIFINAHNKYKYNTRIQIVSVIIVVVFSLILIRPLGILGAAYTFTMFAIVVFTLKFVLSLKIIKGVKDEV